MDFDRLRAAITATLVLVAASPAAAQPSAGTAPGAAATRPAPTTASTMRVLNYAAPVPPGWQAQAPASRFRAAQYLVPGASGATDGELVVFYFGRGQGGSAAANAERWASQFTGADGQPVAPKIATLDVRGMAATVVELSGSYARGVGMGPIGAPKPDQTLLAAVIETPEGHVIVQLHGDRATVDLNRAGFDALVRGFAPG